MFEYLNAWLVQLNARRCGQQVTVAEDVSVIQQFTFCRCILYNIEYPRTLWYMVCDWKLSDITVTVINHRLQWGF